MDDDQRQAFRLRLGDAKSLSNDPQHLEKAAVLANISVAEAMVDLAAAIREYTKAAD